MPAISAADARRNLSRLIQQVTEHHSPVEIVSKGGSAILISKDDYDAEIETAYLLRNVTGRNRLLAAMTRARSSEFTTHELLES